MGSITLSPYWPFAVLLLSVAAVILLITRWRFHPFAALMLASILVGLVSPSIPEVPGQHSLVTAIELPMAEFGIMAGKIAWVIALAAVIGTAMMESGAAEQIVNWLLRLLGEKRAAVALLISGFILSIPVFFDTVFFLLIPIGLTLARKTGKNLVMYVAAIGGGGVISHSIVPPTPGPLIMAETFNIDLGTFILAGIGAGIIPGIAAIVVAKWLNKRMEIPVRVDAGAPSTLPNRPPLALSVMPVLVPLLMISLASVVEITSDELPGIIALQGNKNVAMAAGTCIALLLWSKYQNLRAREIWTAVAKPLEIGGIIILITSAGGAYGAMIKHSGIGDSINQLLENFHMPYLLLAWVLAAVMKIAQGSGTVSIITSSAIMAALIGQETSLGYHPIYILLSIGFGSLFISWMNDSGFWVVSRMSGFTEKEGLKTWTFLLAILALVGLAEVLVFSWIFPLV